MSASVTSPSDVELVQRMARGDRDALGALYERHAPRLSTLAQHILGRSNEAEDLLHDVFLEAWRHAANYTEARGSVWAWLCVRTRSRAIDRRRASPRNVSLEGFPDRSPLEELVEGDLELSPERDKLRSALLEMSREEREVLALGYFEGMSSSEIADAIRIPVGTVKSRTRSALAKLRERLLGKGGER
ncbi:MAG TPA: sigma-70 family RNA polymerase sigma factor [Polyangiaceae bacterium]|nr:sigma-70 family RNA polymerase sigma factor [Polyangiaceae bacterium]